MVIFAAIKDRDHVMGLALDGERGRKSLESRLHRQSIPLDELELRISHNEF